MRFRILKKLFSAGVAWLFSVASLNADTVFFTVAQDGNPPSSPISQATQSQGITTGVYVPFGTLNSVGQSISIRANAANAQAFGIYASGENVSIGTVSANISASAPNGSATAVMIDAPNGSITLASGTISSSGGQGTYGIYAAGSLAVNLPAGSYVPVEGDIRAVNLTTSGTGIFSPSDCALYIENTLNLGASLVFSGSDKSEVHAKSIVIQGRNELWLQGSGTRNLYADSVSGGVVYGYNLVFDTYTDGAVMSLANLTVDATTLAVNSDVEINGSMNFRYSTDVNFTENFAGGNVSFGDVAPFYTGPVVLNFSKQFSPNGTGNTGMASFNKVNAVFSGGLLMSATSAGNYDVLSFSNNAKASLNGGTLTFDFSNYAAGGNVGIDFFDGLSASTISDIGAVEIVGAVSELDEAQIIAAITQGTFSAETVIFNIPFTPAKIPFQTSLAARENVELIFAQHLDAISTPRVLNDGEYYFGVKNINRFASDNDSWRQSFGAQAYVGRGFDGGSLWFWAGGFESETGDEFHKSDFDSLVLTIGGNVEIFENLEAFASLSYSRAFCDGKRFAPDDVYKTSWNSDTIGALAGLRAPLKISEIFTLAPLAAVSFANVWNPETDEGGGENPTALAARSYSSFRILAGLEVNCRLSESVVLSARGLWSRETMDDSYGVSATYIKTRGAYQYFDGKSIGRNSAIVGAGLFWKFWENAGVSLDYAAEVRGGKLSNNIFVGIGIEL